MTINLKNGFKLIGLATVAALLSSCATTDYWAGAANYDPYYYGYDGYTGADVYYVGTGYSGWDGTYDYRWGLPYRNAGWNGIYYNRNAVAVDQSGNRFYPISYYRRHPHMRHRMGHPYHHRMAHPHHPVHGHMGMHPQHQMVGHPAVQHGRVHPMMKQQGVNPTNGHQKP